MVSTTKQCGPSCCHLKWVSCLPLHSCLWGFSSLQQTRTLLCHTLTPQSVAVVYLLPLRTYRSCKPSLRCMVLYQMKQEYDDSYRGTWSRLTLLLKTQDLNGAIFPNGSFMGSPVPREILDIPPYTGFVDDSYPELLDIQASLLLKHKEHSLHPPTQHQWTWALLSQTTSSIHTILQLRPCRWATTRRSHHALPTTPPPCPVSWVPLSCVHSCLKHVSYPCPLGALYSCFSSRF